MQFDFHKEARVKTDASEFAIAAILTQIQADDHWHPTAFSSRKLKPSERNYATHDQELLAILEAFKCWRHYLEGSQHQTIVLTDHNNLRYFLDSKPLSRRQAH